MINRQLRQVLIDIDPNTGDVVGATKIYQRQVVEDDKVLGTLEPENEDLKVEDVPTLWNGTSDSHVRALAESEKVLEAEREAHDVELAAKKEEISNLETQVKELQAENRAQANVLTTIRKALA